MHFGGFGPFRKPGGRAGYLPVIALIGQGLLLKVTLFRNPCTIGGTARNGTGPAQNSILADLAGFSPTALAFGAPMLRTAGPTKEPRRHP